tara:strand:- start:590 stop:1099 length:510 start_codon:yes stop_codon:yes gene_type:complete
MNRKHDKEYYISIIEKLKKINKNVKISSDFIVGYPEETEKDFQDTIELVKKIGFVNSYSFIFSPRPGTPAANKKLVNLTESKKRLKKLQEILEIFQHKDNEKYLQQNCEVLVENKLDNQEKYFGRTKYMTPVIFQANECKIGELVSVEITSLNKKNLFGIYKNNNVKAA